MFITSFDQIQQLFDSEVPESQYLDYKEKLYAISKDQQESETKRKKDKFEVLKDVGSFLNSESGTIVLGIKEDLEKGKPLGIVENHGIADGKFTKKYLEIIERQISLSFSPVCQIDIRRVPNEKRKKYSFLIINIPIQHYPLFAVIRSKDGAEDYAFWRIYLTGLAN